MQQVWKPVVGYEGLYEVSSLGTVRSVARDVPHGSGGGRRRLQSRELRPYAVKKGHGYFAWHVSLSRRGCVSKRRVSHLVLEAFDRPRGPGEVARHLDGDPSNDSWANLAWGTQADNGADMVRHGTSPRGERNGNARLSRSAVQRIREEAAAGANHAELAELYHVSRRTIRRVIRHEVYP